MTEQRDECPGTKLHGRKGVVYGFVLVSASLELLKSAANGLFEWLQPRLPDDLCFLNVEKKPWLTTISHERDAYLSVTEDQLEIILAAVPNLKVRKAEESPLLLGED